MSTKSERIENIVQVAILVAVGLMAGAASFTHVHDWTMANSPRLTPGWFGWANAVISELTPIAAGLEARRRKRHRQSIKYPVTLLIASAGLSLAAQVAVAKPGFTGALLSAVPALAFMALVKLVISRTPTDEAPDEPEPHTETEPSTQAGDSASTETSWQPSTERDHRPVTPTAHPTAELVTQAPQPAPAEPVAVPAALTMSAQMAAFTHQSSTGQPIGVDTLAERLGVDNPTAQRLLADLGIDTPKPQPPARINGHNLAEAIR